MSFREAINEEGFDVDFRHDSHESTLNLDRTLKEKGLIFDGFTYYKPELSPRRKGQEIEEPEVESKIKESEEVIN